MKRLLGLLVLLALSTVPAMAQLDNTPKLEAGGGFLYRSYNLQFAPRQNEVGWFATADYNFNSWVGIAADIDEGFRGTNVATDEYRHYSFLFGPQVYPLGHHRLTPFAHALFGVSHFTFPLPIDEGFTDSGFAFALGGGVDWRATRLISIRLGQFDYEQDQNFGCCSSGNPTQHNFKLKAGVLLTF